jgi:hypothetical protein
MMSKAKPKRLNPVAKFAQKFNRCAVFTDKKKRAGQGYAKHKRAEVFTSALLLFRPLIPCSAR